MTHKLKTLPQYFANVLDGSKTFEVRKNDRGFQKGDKVILREFDDKGKWLIEEHRYTGRQIEATIGYVCSSYQKEGYVTFSLLNVNLDKTDSDHT